MDQIFIWRLNYCRFESLYPHCWAARDFTSWHLPWYEVIWNLIIIPETMEMWEAGAWGCPHSACAVSKYFPSSENLQAKAQPCPVCLSHTWGMQNNKYFQLNLQPTIAHLQSSCTKTVCGLCVASFYKNMQTSSTCNQYLSKPRCDYK